MILSDYSLSAWNLTARNPPSLFAGCPHDWLSCPLLSSAFLRQGTCCSGSSCSCPLAYTHTASFYFSLGACIHLHGYSNYRMPNNLLLRTLLRITCTLGSPLPGLLATSLGSAILVSPCSRLLPNMCSCVSQISLLFFVFSTKRHSGNKVWSQLWYCFSFILCARPAVPYCLHVCSSSPTFLIWGSQAGRSPFVQGAQGRVLICARGSTDVVQNNDRSFSHTLVASPFSLHQFCCLFWTMRFRHWQVMFCYDSWHGYTLLSVLAQKQTEPRLIATSTWRDLLSLLPPVGGYSDMEKPPVLKHKI